VRLSRPFDPSRAWGEHLAAPYIRRAGSRRVVITTRDSVRAKGTSEDILPNGDSVVEDHRIALFETA
jgi:hypothetical protein